MRKLFLLMGFCAGVSLFAQKKDIDTSVFFQESEYNVALINALKIQDNPGFVDTLVTVPLMSYRINSRVPDIPVTVDSITPAVMVGQPLKKLYKHYVKGGLGTYFTPLFEYTFSSGRSKSLSYDIRLKHLSGSSTLKDVGYAGYADNYAGGMIKYFIGKHSLTNELDYTRNGLHYYGYDAAINTIDNRDITHQAFTLFRLQTNLRSHYQDSSRFNHFVTVKFQNLSDLYNVMENNLFVKGEAGRTWEHQWIGADVEVDFLNDRIEFMDTVNSTIIRFQPWLKYKGKKWITSIGVDLSEHLSAKNKFYFYYKIEFNYNVADYILVPFAGIRGGLDRNSYKTLSDVNPFVKPETATDVLPTDRKYEAYGGLRGSLSSSVAYKLQVSYARLNNMPFFVNDTVTGVPDVYELLQNRFRVVYDTVNHLCLSGELNFQKTEKMQLILKGEYNYFEMRNQLYPWHKPRMKLTASMKYNLKKKIYANIDVFVFNKQLALVTKSQSENGAVELKGYADINLSLEYRPNKRLSFFLNMQNLASSRYYKWNQYPSQRLNILGGASFSF